VGLLLVGGSVIQGKDIYVESGGKGSGTCGVSSVEPCALDHAVEEVAGAGDTLLLMGSFDEDDYGTGLNISYPLELVAVETDGAAFFVPSPGAEGDPTPYIFSLDKGATRVVFDGVAFLQVEPGPGLPRLTTREPGVADALAGVAWELLVVAGDSRVVLNNITVEGIQVLQDVTTDSVATHPVMGCIVRVHPSALHTQLELNDVILSDLAGVIGVYYGEPQEPGGSLALSSTNLLVQRNSLTAFATIWFEEHEVAAKSVSVELEQLAALENSAQIVGGIMPVTEGLNASVTVSNLLIANSELYMGSAEEQFSYFWFSKPNVISITDIVAVNNSLLNVSDAEVDPTLFAIIGIDFKKKDRPYSGLISRGLFVENTNIGPILVSCNKNTPVTMEVSDSEFVDQTVAVGASVTFVNAAKDSSLTLRNNVFANNTVMDATTLVEWNLGSGGVIFCDGSAELLVAGNQTRYSGNDDAMRAIFGSCKKSCELPEKTALKICGVQGTTIATYIFSAILATFVIIIAVYHVVFVTIILKRRDAEYKRLDALDESDD